MNEWMELVFWMLAVMFLLGFTALILSIIKELTEGGEKNEKDHIN